jgi:hypothetical protein
VYYVGRDELNVMSCLITERKALNKLIRADPHIKLKSKLWTIDDLWTKFEIRNIY